MKPERNRRHFLAGAVGAGTTVQLPFESPPSEAPRGSQVSGPRPPQTPLNLKANENATRRERNPTDSGGCFSSYSGGCLFHFKNKYRIQ
jgi:hypothetical protein